MPKVTQPSLTLSEVEEVIAAHGMTDAVAGKMLVEAALPPLPLFATYYPYRRYLMAMVKRNPRAVVGWSGGTRESPLARFIAASRGEGTVVFVRERVIVLNDVRFQTPEWVRHLILAEKLYGRGSIMHAQDALTTLDIVLEDIERREDAQEAARGHAVAR